MARAKEQIGFGFVPSESKHHFLVVIPKTATGKVLIYERFDWGTEEENSNKISGELSIFDPPEQKIDHRFDRLKCELSKNKWKEVETALRTEFNLRLKEYGQKPANWKQGQTAVQ